MCAHVHDLESREWSQKQEARCTRKYDKDDKSDEQTRRSRHETLNVVGKTPSHWYYLPECIIIIIVARIIEYT